MDSAVSVSVEAYANVDVGLAGGAAYFGSAVVGKEYLCDFVPIGVEVFATEILG